MNVFRVGLSALIFVNALGAIIKKLGVASGKENLSMVGLCNYVNLLIFKLGILEKRIRSGLGLLGDLE